MINEVSFFIRYEGVNWRDNDRVNRSFQGVLTVAAEVHRLLPFSFQFFTCLAAVFSIAEKGLGTQVGTQSSCLIIFRLWPRVVPPGLARTTHPL